MPPTVPHIIFGVRLALFTHNWGKITMNSYLLETVHHRYSIEFLSFQPHRHPPPRNSSLRTHPIILQQEVDALLLKSVIEQGARLLLTVLPHPEKVRPILDLQVLNTYQKVQIPYGYASIDCPLPP